MEFAKRFLESVVSVRDKEEKNYHRYGVWYDIEDLPRHNKEVVLYSCRNNRPRYRTGHYDAKNKTFKMDADEFVIPIDARDMKALGYTAWLKYPKYGIPKATLDKTNNAKAEIQKVKAFAKSNPDEAKIKAKQILIKTGVLTKTGEKKDTIVSWE